MKTIKIRHFQYMCDDPYIRDIEISKTFEAGGRLFAVCKDAHKPAYYGVYDVLTGCKMPGFVTTGRTIKEKVSTTVDFFKTNDISKVNFHLYPQINP